MYPGADSASSTAGQPEPAGATTPGPLGSHGPGGEAGRRSAPAAAAVAGGGGEEEAAEDEEDEDPGSSRFVLAAGLGLLAVSVVHLGQERAEAGGGGPPCLALLLLRLALYAGCASVAAALGTLIVLVCRGRRRLPPPDFAAAAPVLRAVGTGPVAQGIWRLTAGAGQNNFALIHACPHPPIKSSRALELILDRPEKLLLEMRIPLRSCCATGCRDVVFGTPADDSIRVPLAPHPANRRP
ncbi:hypothetical protein AAES_125609 [Amazona aestiva]|uniref:Uncharacterized protein n=1 Tax=Amazona aestiva TaxID=12930 RepID=A0A0Q3UR85_AMAAE|nr:hypothetical protein AAES_125609 [Amazona aestiva]